MVDCLFCRIISGELPCEIIASSNQCIAFRDIKPVAPTHILVIPKVHIDDASKVTMQDGQVLADMFTTAQEVAFIENIHSSGYRLVLNIGDDAGNSVPHLHLHVIGGQPMGWPPF